MIDFSCKKFQITEIYKCSLGLTKAELQVFLFLKVQTESLTSSQISKKIKLDITTVQKALKKLHDQELLLRTQHNFTNGGYEFSYRIKPSSIIKKHIMDRISLWTNTIENKI